MKGTPLSAWQLLGVAVANAAAAAFALRQSAAVYCTVCRSSTAAAAAETEAEECSCTGKHAREKSRAAGSGPGRTSSAQALGRLVYIVGATLLVSALFLAYVLAALQPHQHFTHSKQQQQLQPHLLQHPRLLQDPLQQRQGSAFLLSTAEATTGNPAAAWPQGFIQAATSQQQYEGGASINSSAPALSESVQRFLVRDFGRLQCLTALHEASKVRPTTAEGCSCFHVQHHPFNPLSPVHSTRLCKRPVFLYWFTAAWFGGCCIIQDCTYSMVC